jgi:hypothetical protein
MTGGLPDNWPTIWVEAKCSTCGEDLFAELLRPAVLERFLPEQAAAGGISLSAFWRHVLVEHLWRRHQVKAESGESGHEISAPVCRICQQTPCIGHQILR